MSFHQPKDLHEIASLYVCLQAGQPDLPKNHGGVLRVKVFRSHLFQQLVEAEYVRIQHHIDHLIHHEFLVETPLRACFQGCRLCRASTVEAGTG